MGKCHFSDDFIRDALALIPEGDCPIKELSKRWRVNLPLQELGLPPEKWSFLKLAFEPDGGSSDTPKEA